VYVKIVRLATSSWICMKRVCQDNSILKPYNWVANLSRSSSVPVDSLVGNLVMSYFWFWLFAVFMYTYLVLSTGTCRSVSSFNEWKYLYYFLWCSCGGAILSALSTQVHSHLWGIEVWDIRRSRGRWEVELRALLCDFTGLSLPWWWCWSGWQW